MKFFKMIFNKPPGNISCEQVALQLQTYLDNEINDITARKIHDHLELCKMCGLSADSYRFIKQTIASKQKPIPEQAIEELKEFSNNLLDENQS